LPAIDFKDSTKAAAVLGRGQIASIQQLEGANQASRLLSWARTSTGLAGRLSSSQLGLPRRQSKYPDPDSSCQSQFIFELALSFVSSLIIRTRHSQHLVTEWLHRQLYLNPRTKGLTLRFHLFGCHAAL
jgi:hypothetical protein